MEKTEDPTIKTLGSTSLEWYEKDIKKKSPFLLKQKEEVEEPEKVKIASEKQGEKHKKSP